MTTVCSLDNTVTWESVGVLEHWSAEGEMELSVDEHSTCNTPDGRNKSSKLCELQTGNQQECLWLDENRNLVEKLIVVHLFTKFNTCIETSSSLPYSQQLAACRYPQPNDTISSPPPFMFKIYFNIHFFIFARAFHCASFIQIFLSNFCIHFLLHTHFLLVPPIS